VKPTHQHGLHPTAQQHRGDPRRKGRRRRQANTDLHSLRRWFIWSAREALLKGANGYSQWTIAEGVGHAKREVGLEMTMSRYAGDESLEAKAACVRPGKLAVVKPRLASPC
jgi:hypothetical protein